jgi:hypothetical protein
MKPTWRIDSVGRGQLAWLYVIPHACEWPDVSAAVGQDYEITEEAQTLVDDQLGGCPRYLAVKLN